VNLSVLCSGHIQVTEQHLNRNKFMNLLKQLSTLILRPSTGGLGTLAMPLFEPEVATVRATFGMS